MGRLYWILTSLVLAVAVHAAYVLTAPAQALKRSMADLVADAGVNTFFIVPPKGQARLFPSYPPAHVFGACAFDVGGSRVDIIATLPDDLWTLTIYTASGDALYTLNDIQSGTGRFTVSLSLAPSLLEMLSMAGGDDAISTTGWDVKTAEPTGLAVFWIPVREEAMRPGVIRRLSETACRAGAAAS